MPQTFLAFRTWTLDRTHQTLGSTTPAGGFSSKKAKEASWMVGALGIPLGAWPKDGESMEARCSARDMFEDDDQFDVVHLGKDGRVASPGPECKGSGGHGCGIYSTTDLGIINTYLSRTAPVLGVVELGGRVLPCPQGYRAEFARVAAILLIDEVLTKPVSHDMLRKIARAYDVPALIPHSTDPEQYREAIENANEITGDLDSELRDLLGR